MFRHPEPEVLVVGAGPVGLLAALFLQQQGVRVEIIDTKQQATQHSYALAIHPRTLRILDSAGLAGRLVSAGRKLTKVAYYEGAERRAEIDYSTLATRHPYLLVVRQSLLESVAADALRELKLKVLWGHRLEALSVEGGIIQARVAKLDHVSGGYAVAQGNWVVAHTETIHPAFVIGADGYDSAVRRMSGIEMEQHGAEELFAVYEIEAEGELPAEVRVILDPDMTSVYWPLEEGRCRWGFQIRDRSEHEASMERLERLVRARAPWFTARPTRLYWSTLGLFERRLARSFGHAGVWLAGDAAHQAAPVGVHSMNSGLAEARELAMRIARSRHPGGSDSLLQEFAASTRNAWQWLLGAGDEVRVLPGAAPWVQQFRTRIPGCVPASGDDFEPLLRQVGLTTTPARREAGQSHTAPSEASPVSGTLPV